MQTAQPSGGLAGGDGRLLENKVAIITGAQPRHRRRLPRGPALIGRPDSGMLRP